MMQAFEISFFAENYSLLPSFNGNYKDRAMNRYRKIVIVKTPPRCK